MGKYVDQISENKTYSANNVVVQQKNTGHPIATLVDNRPEADVQKQMQNSIKNSQRVLQLKSQQSFANHVVQLATVIHHKAGQASFKGKTGPVGLEMDANLDPADPVQGSAPDSAIDAESAPLYNAVSASNPKAYARGHLLNHDLGGLGVSDNLYPISAGANARHSIIAEQNVKKYLVLAQKANADLKQNLFHVQYSVRVLGTPAHSQFLCNWAYWNTVNKTQSEAKQAVIESKLDNTDPYQPAGHEIGLLDWSHGLRKGAVGLAFYKAHGKINISKDGVAGALKGNDKITVLTADQIAEQRKWALEHPKELSEEDIKYWAALDKKHKAEEVKQHHLESFPQQSTRSKTSGSKTETKTETKTASSSSKMDEEED